MSYNITVRAETKKALLAEVDTEAKSQKGLSPELRKAIEDIIAAVPEIKGGYLQLTTFGTVGKEGSSIVFNLTVNPAS